MLTIPTTKTATATSAITMKTRLKCVLPKAMPSTLDAHLLIREEKHGFVRCFEHRR